MSPERRFDDVEASVGRSRRFVASETADVPPSVREVVVLMVSELATNAIVHATGGFAVRVDREAGAIRVTVTDGGSGRPVVRDPDDREPHGRGLRIVDELSDDWGTHETAAHGNAVWFLVDTGADGDGTGPGHRARPDDGPAVDGDGGGRQARSSYPVPN